MSKELAIDEVDSKYSGLLEKKWTSVIRLQKKIMDLEQTLSELRDSIPSYQQQSNGKLDLTTWTPRAPARHTLVGHRQPITSIAFHPTYNIIATASEDSAIKIWDWETGEFERTLKSHTKAVTSIDFCPAPKTDDAKSTITLASCSNDLTIKIWDADDDYKCVKTLQGHDHVISAVKYIPPNGDRIASVSRDKTIKIWEVSTGFCLNTIAEAHTDWIRCIAPSPDGQYILTAGSDQLAKLRNLTSNAVVDLRGHEHVIECVAFAPSSSSKYLPKQHKQYLATGSRDKSIKIWSATGTCIMTLEGHGNWVRGLSFHPDGKYLLSVSDDKTMKVWDLEQSRCARTIDAHSHFISCVAFAGAKKYLVATGSIDQTIKIWTP